MTSNTTTKITRKRISFDIPDLIIEEKVIRRIVFPKEEVRKKKK